MNIYRVRYFWRKDVNAVTYVTFIECNNGEEAAGLFHLHHEDDDVQITSVDLWA